MRRLLAVTLSALALGAAQADPISVLFVGNSYTFGRVDPVMSYNTANVRDLTAPMWLANPDGSNAFEPHPWGGVAGIFKQFTVQAGLDYDVALSTRNAASLRGHMLNSNPAGWDMRGNIASQTWNKVVLQEQSDEPLLRRPGLASNPEYFRYYADAIEDFVHSSDPTGTLRNRDAFAGATSAERQAACIAAGISSGTCSIDRGSYTNSFASAATEMFLYQTWARPNLVDGALVTQTDETTGAVTRTGNAATTYFNDLESMTAELKAGYQAAFDQATADGSIGFSAIAPVGESFLRAVTSGVATRDMYAADALTDGLIDLWFDDGTHASKYGSYLSALTLFGTLTGLDPASLGAGEIAAQELGISVAQALALQRVASDQLGFAAAIPEPETYAMLLAGLGLLGVAARRKRPQPRP
ncbi:PEP-CTERM sorting domain-containing protein [Comamonadaceae bacterium G21597-S1]|nr:PEP-CTERM sorting domain-containing protein [Comamonadaceae bacterium G21597-S1]